MPLECGDPRFVDTANPPRDSDMRILGPGNRLYPVRIPTLPGGAPNPSSSHALAPVENCFLPWYKPGFFRGHFQTQSSNPAGQQGEMGFNDGFEISEDVTDLTDGTPTGLWTHVGFTTRHYTDPKRLASETLTQLTAGRGSNLKGTYTIKYLDERDTDRDTVDGVQVPRMRFVFNGTTRFKVRNVVPRNTLANYGMSDSAAYLNTITGAVCLHTEEYIIFEAERDAAFWFALVNCNFDLGYSVIGPTASNPWGGMTPARGYPRLMLLGSDTLSDLEADWLSTSKFVAGVNKFVFVDEVDSSQTTNPIAKAGTYYGADRAYWLDTLPTAIKSIVLAEQTPFPSRTLIASLRAWATTARTYRYWRLHFVNPGNRARRLSPGFPILDPGWYGEYNVTPEISRGFDSRSEIHEAPDGTLIPEPKPGRRVWKFAFPAHAMTDQDVRFAESRFHRPPKSLGTASSTTWPNAHHLNSDRSRLAVPSLIIDPVFNPGRGRGSTGSGYTLSGNILTVPIAGRVSSVSDPGSLLLAGIQVGDLVSGTYSYNVTTTGTGSGPKVYSDAAGTLEFFVGKYAFTAGSGIGGTDISVLNDTLDSFGIGPAQPQTMPGWPDTFLVVSFILTDATATAIASEVLPRTGPTLAAWSSKQITIDSSSISVRIQLFDTQTIEDTAKWARGSIFGPMNLTPFSARHFDQWGLEGEITEGAPW